MSKHTPGPWHRNIKPASKYTTVWSGRNKHVARVETRGLTEAEIEANISLIAAAPDLLEAMKRLDRLYKGICMMVPDDEMAACQEVWAEADAAIAKAEGQS